MNQSVGSGSAGSVVALRLSESPDTTVLVLEAGSNGGKFLNAPMEGPAMQRTAADWQYKTVPQTSACFGLKLNVNSSMELLYLISLMHCDLAKSLACGKNRGWKYVLE